MKILFVCLGNICRSACAEAVMKKKVQEAGLEDVPVKVALMGCVVNGPGEAREADVGIAGGIGEAVLFRKGEIVEKIPEDQVIDRLIREIRLMKDGM